MKICTKCKEAKPFDQFGYQKEGKNGLRSSCKKCVNCISAAYKAANPGKVRMQNAIYCAENKEKRSAYHVSWRKANPEKIRSTKAAWVKANSEKKSAAYARWRAANPEKVQSRLASWRAANREKVRAYCVAYRATNSEKMKAKSAAWKAANPEKARAGSAAWKAANPEMGRIYKQNRRARKLASGGKLSSDLADKLLKLQKGKCACCGLKLGKKYHLDHIMPLALGGTNTDDNIQLLRSTCNQQKHAKHPIDFMQQRGFLL